MEPDIKKLNQLLLSGICSTLSGSQKRADLRSFDRCGDDDGAL